MGSLLIVNGSPRAPRSNSRRYAELFQSFWPGKAAQYMVTEQRHAEVCETLEAFSHLLFVFPLYADGLPVTLMHFLKELERHNVKRKPTVHVLVNCGFLEPDQSLVACDMLRLFCRQNSYPFGSALCIGSGEAILDTPFAYLAKRKIKKLASAIEMGTHKNLKVTMPLPKRVYISASTKYWLRYGEKYRTTKEQMDTMKIE